MKLVSIFKFFLVKHTIAQVQHPLYTTIFIRYLNLKLISNVKFVDPE